MHPILRSNEHHCHSDIFFGDCSEKIIFDSADFRRVQQTFDDECSQLVDHHSVNGIRIQYLRVSTKNAPKIVSFSSETNIMQVSNSSEVGTLLRVERQEKFYTVWVPSTFGIFRFDDHQRLSVVDHTVCRSEWNFDSRLRLRLEFSENASAEAVIPYVIADDSHEQLANDLTSFQPVERRLYRKSDWFTVNSPSSIWTQMIGGSLYDPRVHRRINKRFKCQQCALAWWDYLGYLHKETSKTVYRVLQDEVAFSVLLDMSETGEWGHGYWSDRIETHARFHLDGLHLLLSQSQKTNDSLWLNAAERGMRFVMLNLLEKLDNKGVWFLHDTIEGTIPRRVNSTLFGKTPGNSFCINTHVQALTVLHRLSQMLPEEKKYTELFNQGLQSLRRVLEHQPAQLVYQFLIWWLLKYKSRVSAKSYVGKLRNVLEGIIMPRLFWLVRRRFPRIAFPGGFIERDLTLSFFSDRYHITNLKDLLMLYKLTPVPWLRGHIVQGFKFVFIWLEKITLGKAIEASPYYFEFMEILFLYRQLIEKIPLEQIHHTEEVIRDKTGGYSLDFYASDLVIGASRTS